MTTYRIRRAVAVATSASVPLLCGVVLALALSLTIGPVWVCALLGLVFAVVAITPIVRRVRRRSLTAYDDVLVVQRDQYRLVVPWQGISAVQRRRHQVVMDVEELVCSGGRVVAIDSRGRPSTVPQGLEEHPALTRVMVSLYARDWRLGPIGDRVRSTGIDV